jgi:hypothetical protein
MTKRLALLMGGALLILWGAAIPLWIGTVNVSARGMAELLPAALLDEPVNNWRVCQDLGVGPVPGLNEYRQRFRLCHNQGWEALAYCLDPSRPAPALGTMCSQTGTDTYWCGVGLQRLREYRMLVTPTLAALDTETPTVTPSPIPTLTFTPSPTLPPAPTEAPSATPSPIATATLPVQPTLPAATVSPRVRPGGLSLLEWAGQPLLAFQQSLATPTPFQPAPPTPVSTQSVPAYFSGVDFSRNDQRIRILIYPPDERVNGGRPLSIRFAPGESCEYRDHRACVTSFLEDEITPVTFVTVHSGIGGEAEDFRQAVEGMGWEQAAFSLRQIRENLQALEGAQVTIIQGKRRTEGLTLAALRRVPPARLEAYFTAPVENALDFAPGLEILAQTPATPLLVFETCGWQLAEEAWAEGVTPSSASIYLGVIAPAQ